MKQVNLKIRGCKDKNLKNKIAKAVQVSKRHLMPRMGGVHVEIKLVDNLGFYGLCAHNDDKDYTIEINNDGDIKEMLMTVIHEMTHVKQYIRKELIGGFNGCYLWKGNIFTNISMEDSESPWESEAYNTELALIEKVM